MFEGILTVTVTPFDAEGWVDFDAYGRLVEFVLGEGVHAVIPLGSTGEFYALDMEERRQVLRFVAEAVRGRGRLLAGCNSANVREIVALGNEARELGYEALLLAAPPYSLPNAEELAAHFGAVARAVDLPIMLYNFPARTGVDMGPEFLERIRPLKSLFGIKESSGSLARMHELVVRYGDRLDLICGADDQALEYFLWGAKSWVAGASNFLPKEHVELYEACVKDRDFERGLALMRKLLPLFMFLEGGKYIQSVKYGCELAGVPCGDPRPPLRPLTDEEKAEMRRLYEAAVG
jgi:4-hydroxy-tetrahydrodipicolinate synthase